MRRPARTDSRGGPPGGRLVSGLASRLEQDRVELIPIDHGFCLPETLEPPFLEWLHWPQVLAHVILCHGSSGS